MMVAQKPISLQVTICRGQFQTLLNSGSLEQFEPKVPMSKWKDELGRFRVWITSTGAHQNCQSSLDYRLRDSSHIRSQVTRQLRRLHHLLIDLHDVTNDEPATESSNEELELEVDVGEEVQLIYSDLVHTITRLHEMSIIIRKPSAHDRLKYIQKSDYLHFELNDREHVYAKYPGADTRILDRLGVAVSKRRAVLKYRGRHPEMLGHGADEDMSINHSGAILNQSEDQSMYASSAQSEADQDMTSYGDLIMESDHEIAHLSPPENAVAGHLFQCELCQATIEIKDKTSWIRHIFSDLMPYICVFPDCMTPDRLYERRHQWLQHVDSHHPLALEHPSNEHSTGNCILCHEHVAGGSGYHRHLAKHQENLSLFALPRSFLEKCNNSGFVNGEDEGSLASMDEDSVEEAEDETNMLSNANQLEDSTHIIQDDDQSNQQPGYYLQNLNYSPFEAAAVGSSFGWVCCHCGQLNNEGETRRCYCCNDYRCALCTTA